MSLQIALKVTVDHLLLLLMDVTQWLELALYGKHSALAVIMEFSQELAALLIGLMELLIRTFD